MTSDDILRMAREATDHLPDADSIRLQGIVLLDLDAGAAAEREACAQIADAEASIEGIAQRIAAAIRARSKE